MRVAVIIQARMGSQRLPGKVLLKLKGHSVLWHIIKRVEHSLCVDEIIVATTTASQDDEIVDECRKINIPVFRGDEQDVLKRYYLASKLVKSDIICRVTSDNPLVEPIFIDMAIARMNYSSEDYVNIDGAALGTGIEIFTKKILKTAAKNAKENYQREHVTPFMRENFEICSYGKIAVPENFYCPDLRLTVDTPEDFIFMKEIYNRLYKENSIVSLAGVIRLLTKEKPELRALNSHIRQRSVV